MDRLNLRDASQYAIPMTILFLHGWHSVPGGVKPTYLKDHGHTVINPALDDDDFAAALATAHAEFDRHQPEVVVGSSRGGAVAMNINSGNAKLVLLCPLESRSAVCSLVGKRGVTGSLLPSSGRLERQSQNR